LSENRKKSGCQGKRAKPLACNPTEGSEAIEGRWGSEARNERRAVGSSRLPDPPRDRGTEKGTRTSFLTSTPATGKGPGLRAHTLEDPPWTADLAKERKGSAERGGKKKKEASSSSSARRKVSRSWGAIRNDLKGKLSFHTRKGQTRDPTEGEEKSPTTAWTASEETGRHDTEWCNQNWSATKEKPISDRSIEKGGRKKGAEEKERNVSDVAFSGKEGAVSMLEQK